MRSRLVAPRQDVYVLIVAGAFTLGLGVLRSLQAQEPGPPAKGPGLAVDNASSHQATSDPKSKLRAQQLATRKAEAIYEIAKLTRELTEIAQQEYIEYIFPQDLASIVGEIRLAESDLARAKDRLERARFEKRFFPQALSEELTFKKAQFTLEQAQSKRKVLVEYTRGKTIKELESEVEKARVSEVVKKKAWEPEKAKEAELKRQLLPDTR